MLTNDVATLTTTATIDLPDLFVRYDYLTAGSGNTIVVVSFYAEHGSGETTVQAVQAAIESHQPGKTVIVLDTANEN